MKLDELLKKEQEKRIKRRKTRHIESSIQRACVHWFRLRFPKYIIFSVPNGGMRNKIEAAILKAEGALSGVSDLIAVAEKSVLFIEMKSEKGRQQQSQKDFQKKVESLGHRYIICHDLMEFQAGVERWLKDSSKIDLLLKKP